MVLSYRTAAALASVTRPNGDAGFRIANPSKWFLEAENIRQCSEWWQPESDKKLLSVTSGLRRLHPFLWPRVVLNSGWDSQEKRLLSQAAQRTPGTEESLGGRAGIGSRTTRHILKEERAPGSAAQQQFMVAKTRGCL